MATLEGKVALISGGSRGQGEAEGRLFAREGAAVVLGDILDGEGEQVAASINDAGGRATYLHLDVREEADWTAAVERTVSEYGRLTTVINNAGTTVWGPTLDETTLEQFRGVLEVNLIGVFLGMKTAIPALKAAGEGSIVNTSSTAGLEGVTRVGGYVASKWGVRGLTKVAALELASFGIRVNSVHPGPIDVRGTTQGQDPAAHWDSPMPAPLGRRGLPSEVADLMRFLASDESVYCTGTEFTIDGALTAGRLLGPPEEP